jgi:hypothetical protein
MPKQVIPFGRVELERQSVSKVTNNFTSYTAIRENRQAIEENRKAIDELRQMLQAIIEHLDVPYNPAENQTDGD